MAKGKAVVYSKGAEREGCVMGKVNYKSEIPQDKIDACTQVNAARSALLGGEASVRSLAYARFLSAMENDATINNGKGAASDDQAVLRDWPFLKGVVEMSDG